MTSPGVLIAPEALDELATLAGAGLVASRFAGALVGSSAGSAAQEQGAKATDALLKISKKLEALGGRDLAPIVKPAPVNPLAELALVESSRAEALALLEALRVALPLAEALDQKRGDVLAVPVAGYSGTEWGERVLQAVSGLELELFGPGAEHHGGRE